MGGKEKDGSLTRRHLMASSKTQRSQMQSAPQTARLQLASEHRAKHAAQLGIARWTSGNTYVQMELASALMPTSQVKWHETAQLNFQEWLKRGGFAAEVNAPRNIEATALPAAAPMSHRDTLRGIEILS
jgi:hypothetical protein